MYREELLEALMKYEPWDLEEKKAQVKTINFLKNNDVIMGTDNLEGHIVASAWIVNSSRDKVLMTHHKILDIWVQLGGHTDEGETAYMAAKREGYEESGLKSINDISKKIFDLDVHFFPEIKKKKAHYHYDIRYIFEANEKDLIVVSNESKDLKWISFGEFHKYTRELALIRMVEKSKLK